MRLWIVRSLVAVLGLVVLCSSGCASGSGGDSGDQDVVAPGDGAVTSDGDAVDVAVALADALSVDISSGSDSFGEDAGAADDAASEDTGPIDPANPGPPPEHIREAFVPPDGALNAGVAMRYVDGPVGVSMAGFGGRFGGIRSTWSDQLNGSRGFYSYATVKAIALEEGGERLILLKIPMMCSENALLDGTVAKLRELYDIDLEGRIITGATHSHHMDARYWRIPNIVGSVGIDTVDEEIIDRLSTIFAETVKDALDDLGPAEWGYTWQDDWDPNDEIYHDRRGQNDPEYPKDPRLTLLAVRRLDGTPMATIINFGMHGTTLGSDNELLTEDAPGSIEMKFEELFYKQEGKPIFGMFIQSGGGDSAPSGGFLGNPGEQRVELIGATAAPRILALYRTIEWRDTVSIAVRSRRIDLRYMWMGYADSDEFYGENGEPFYWGTMTCGTDNLPPGESLEGEPKPCTDLGWFLSVMGGVSIPNGEVHQAYLTVARLGPLYLVTLPGEPAYSTIKYTREQIAEHDDTGDILVFGYSQDHLLYLTHPDDWYMGGYETNMSLWGPLLAKYLVDRQMELVDDIREGFAKPYHYEESPSLSPPTPFEPRAFERSVALAEVTEAAPATIERGQNLKFAWNGGDPSIGSPLVELQRADGEGHFADVPSPSGWPGHALDNTRFRMVTQYLPSPSPSSTVLEERTHTWKVDWEVPADFPAGTYRLHVSGPAWDGAEVQTYAIDTTPFEVVKAASTAVDAVVADGTLSFHMTMACPSYEDSRGHEHPEAAWRLLDAHTRYGEPVQVRAPLTIRLSVGGDAQEETHEVLFDEAAGAYLFDLSRAGVGAEDSVSAIDVWITADNPPSPITASL